MVNNKFNISTMYQKVTKIDIKKYLLFRFVKNTQVITNIKTKSKVALLYIIQPYLILRKSYFTKKLK